MKRNSKLAVAVAAIVGGFSSRAAAESIQATKVWVGIEQSIPSPMPPEVEKKEMRAAWKRAQRAGKY